jgi:hypothetical protein
VAVDELRKRGFTQFSLFGGERRSRFLVVDAWKHRRQNRVPRGSTVLKVPILKSDADAAN